MSPAELDKIIEECPEQVQLVLGELHDKIIIAAKESLEAAQELDDGGKPKVAIGLKLVIELNKHPVAWHLDGAVSVAYKIKGAEMTADLDAELEPGMGKSRKPRGGKQ